MTYTSSNPAVASVEGVVAGSQLIKVRTAGTTTITATQTGDTSYNAATSASQNLTVGYYNLFKESISGMALWYDGNNVDADSTPDVKSNGDAMYQWSDGSGNTRHATTGTASAAAAYEASAINGKGALRFAAGDTLDLNPTVSGVKSVFMVFKQTSDGSANTKLLGGDLVTSSAAEKVALQRFGGTGLIDSGVSSSSYNVVSYEASANAYALFVNGASGGTGTDSQALGALNKVGNNVPSIIAEIVAFDRVLPALARQKIEGYLAHKWGLESQLPSVHPYKIVLPTFGGTQEIVFQPLPDRQAGQTVSLSVEASSGLSAFTFDSNDSTVVSISGTTVTALKVGKVTITASQAGDSNWYPATGSQPFIVTATPRADQTITFTALPNKTALDADFDLNATASSTLPVSYASSNTAVATISGVTVSILAEGVTTITASQDGNGSYNPASFATQDLTVTKVPQTINFAAIPNQGLSSGTYTLEANATSGLGLTFTSDYASVATVSGNVVTLLSGGTALITAKQPGNATYAGASDVTQTLTVQDDTQQAQTITWTQSLSGKRFGDTDITLTATASSGGAVTYGTSDAAVGTIVNTNKLKITGAGAITVTATQAGGAISGQEWQAASLTKSFTIAKSTQNIVHPLFGANLPNQSKSVGDFDFDPFAISVDAASSAPTGLPITYSSSNANVATIVSGKVHIVAVGTVTITASQAGTSGYDAATNKTFTLTVYEYNMYANSVAGLMTWLDGTDVNADGQSETPSDFTQVGGVAKVNLWGDRSGNGNHLTQSNTAKMPRYFEYLGNAIQKPFVAFGSTSDWTGGSNSHLAGNLPTSINGSPSITVIVAAMSYSNAANRLIHFGATSGAAGQAMSLAQDSSFDYNNGKLSFAGNFMNAKTVGAFRRSSPTSHAAGEFFRNGTAVNGTATNGSNTLNIPTSGSRETVLGAGRGTNGILGNFFDGAILEVIAFDVALDDWNIRRLEGYLAHKWGLAASLPSNHAFRNQPPTFGGAQTITFADDGSIALNQTKTPDAYASSGLPLTFVSSDPTTIKVENGKVTALKDGSVTITAKQAGDSHFSASTDVTKTFTVASKDPQTITFADPVELGKGLSLNLVATSDSNLTVTLAITAGGDKATLNGTTLTGTALGNVTIQATQAGNNDYLVATPVSRTIAVKKGLNLVFDGIGAMGKNQVVPLRAKVFNKVTNKVIPVPITFTVVSGPTGTAITGGNKVTCGNATGSVVVKATTTNPSGAFAAFAMTSKTTSFTITNKNGQMIVFKHGESGGLRDLPFSRKPIPIGRMVTSMASPTTPTNIPVVLSLVDENGDPTTSNFVKIIGSGANQRLAFKKGATPTSVGGKMQPIAIKLKASAGDNTNYNAAEPVIKDLNILPPGKDAFFNDRIMDDRYTSVRAKFARKLLSRKDLGKIKDLDGDGDTDLDDAKAMFDSDEADSDGDGTSNLLERAFGGDSLGPDTKRNMPRRMPSKGGKQRISFVQYKTAFNEEGIEYIVERSTDLRTWTQLRRVASPC